MGVVTTFSKQWLLEWKDGTKELVDAQPDYSNDYLVEVPRVTRVQVLIDRIGEPYTPRSMKRPGAGKGG